MSGKARLKFGLFLLGIVVSGPLALVIFFLMSQFIASFNQGADPASIFRGHTLAIPAENEAQWREFDRATGKEPSQAQREEIISAYWLAWEAVHRAHETGDTSDLPTYWAGSAYGQVLAAMNDEMDLTMQHGRHTLNLVYFSEDGSVVLLEDEDFGVSYTIDDDIISMTASAAVVMTLDQGFWRIRSVTIHYNI